MNTIPSRTVAGRYKLHALLGQGGMGSVHYGYDEALRRPVAVKTMSWEGLSPDARERAQARLLREARAMAALSHPNIASMFDVCVEDDAIFLVMELVQGRSLREVAREREPIELRVRWLLEIARALAYAHSQGLVHRDIKPENVIVGGDGHAKVIDFGTARAVEDGSTQGTESARAPVTIAGNAIGTPDYMAPEQYLAEGVDPATDQFAWGVLGYELLAGIHPWRTIEGEPEALEVLANRLYARALAPLAGEAPKALVAAIERAMAFDRGARFPSFDKLLETCDALERVSAPAPASEPETAAPDPMATADLAHPPRRSPILAAALTVQSASPLPPSPPTFEAPPQRPTPAPTIPDAPVFSQATPQRRSSARPPHAAQPVAPRGGYYAAGPAPSRPRGVSVGLIILLVVGSFLGILGVCVGIGAGLVNLQPTRTIACALDATGAALCEVTNVSRAGTPTICWDARVTCAGGASVTGHACVAVKTGAKATRKIQPTEMSGKCPQASKVSVESITVD